MMDLLDSKEAGKSYVLAQTNITRPITTKSKVSKYITPNKDEV